MKRGIGNDHSRRASWVTLSRREEHRQLMQVSPMRRSHARNPLIRCRNLYLFQSDVAYPSSALPCFVVTCLDVLSAGTALRLSVTRYLSQYIRLGFLLHFAMSRESLSGIHRRAGVVRQKIKQLPNLVEEPPQPGSCEEILIRPTAIIDTKERFFLWCGTMGIVQNSASEEHSLDRQLAGAPELRDQICDQLDELGEALDDCKLCHATCNDI